MATLSELTAAANRWLDLANIPDFEGALNGLQLEGNREISLIAAAVDASLPVIEEACDRGADLLVVHHGLFWHGAQCIRGPLYRKLQRAITHGLAIYSAHLPLDVHPELGNNIGLLRAIDSEVEAVPFAPWKGLDLGLRFPCGLSRSQLLAKVESATGAQAHLCPGGSETVREVGVITGGAGSQVREIAATGVDTFLTGEGPHWSYTAAEELGLNVIYAGHYATETFGVKALSQHWCDSFPGTSWSFIDHPTGL